MVGTKYLPSLDNVVWERSPQIAGIPLEEQIELPPTLHLAIRRSRISVQILKRPSDNATKYELFQRLKRWRHNRKRARGAQLHNHYGKCAVWPVCSRPNLLSAIPNHFGR
jgi:hypothetical protein